MKIKDSVVITKVDNEYILIDTSQDSSKFDGIVKLNETGNTVCSLLKEDLSFDMLIDKMLEIYEGNRKEIGEDVNKTLDILKEINILI